MRKSQTSARHRARRPPRPKARRAEPLPQQAPEKRHVPSLPPDPDLLPQPDVQPDAKAALREAIAGYQRVEALVARAPSLLRAVVAFVDLYRPSGHWHFNREMPKRWLMLRRAKIVRTYARRVDRDLGRVEDDVQLGEFWGLLEVLRPPSGRPEVDVDRWVRELRWIRERVQTAEDIKLVAHRRRDEWRHLFCAAIAWSYVIALEERPPISRESTFADLLRCALHAARDEPVPQDLFDLIQPAVLATQREPDSRVQKVLDRVMEEGHSDSLPSATRPTR